MTQAARGGVSLLTRSSSEDDADGAFAGELLDGIGAEIGDDQLCDRRASGGASCWRPCARGLPFRVAFVLLMNR